MNDAAARLASLRERFLSRLRDDLCALQHPPSDEEGAEKERLIVHRLAGAAAMFGFPELGEIAGRCDDILFEAGAIDRTLRDALVETLRDVAGA